MGGDGLDQVRGGTITLKQCQKKLRIKKVKVCEIRAGLLNERRKKSPLACFSKDEEGGGRLRDAVPRDQRGNGRGGTGGRTEKQTLRKSVF